MKAKVAISEDDYFSVEKDQTIIPEYIRLMMTFLRHGFLLFNHLIMNGIDTGRDLVAMF